MKPNFSGVETRVRRARCSFRYGTIDNQPVIYIRLPNGREFFTDPENWRDYLRLGFSPNISLDDDGHGRTYPRAMAHCPDKKATRSTTQTLARLFITLRMIREEMTGGERADEKGWVVRHANGNTSDLRDVNLLKVPALRHRNSYRAVWNARERWRLVEQGLNPNDVFARRRKEFKANRNPKYLGGTCNPPSSVSSAQYFPPVPPLNSSTEGGIANG